MPLQIAIDYRPALLAAAGIARATRELAHALAELPELELHLFGHSLAGLRRAAELPPRARLHRRRIPGRCLPWLARLGLGAERLAGNAKVFHWTDYVQPPVGKQTAVVCTVHDLAFIREPAWHGAAAAGLRQRTLAAVQRANAIIVPSQATRRDLMSFLPQLPRLEVIPFGADHLPTHTDAAHPLGGRPYWLCLGTLEPRKNHLALFAAIEQLPVNAPQLCVVGNPGWCCAAIEASLQALVARGRACWLRNVDDRQLLPLLAHAEALLYPSLWEGFGFPPLEAMRLAVPVLAHDNQPMRELGEDALLLVDCRDPAAITEALQRLQRDAALRARLARDGAARAANFRWANCARHHARLYAEVAP